MQGLPYLRATRNFVLNATTLQPTQANLGIGLNSLMELGVVKWSWVEWGFAQKARLFFLFPVWSLPLRLPLPGPALGLGKFIQGHGFL